MAPVLNKPRLILLEFQRRYGYTQVNIAQITTDVWPLWNETQFWQKCLLLCPSGPVSVS